VACVDDRAIRRAVLGYVCRTDKEARDFFDGLLCSGKSYANEIVFDKRLQSLDRDCEMRAPLISDHRVNLIQDHGADGPKHSPSTFAREKEV